MNSKNDKLRVKAVTELEDIIEMGITPLTIEKLAGIEHKKIHRWQSSVNGIWLPSFKDCDRILEFCQVVEAIKKDWMDIVKTWTEKYRRATMAASLKPVYLRILESKRLDFEEKVETLTRMTFRDLAKVGESKVNIWR